MGTPEKRGMLRHYVVAFALLGLIVAGVFLYESLKLEYAIYRVRHTDYPRDAFYPYIQDDKWLMHLATAARHGNRRAMEVAMDHGEVILLGGDHDTWVSLFILLLEAQPELYLDILSGKEDVDALAMLRGAPIGHPGRRSIYAADDRQLDIEICEAKMVEWTRSPEAESARAGELGLEFVRRRFAKELDIARQPAPPGP